MSGLLRSLRGGELQSRAHRAQQVGIVHRFREEIHGPRLDRAHARRYVAVAGEEDDRHENAGAGEPVLQLHPIEFRHGDIEDEARCFLCAMRGEELARRGKRADFEALRAQQAGERLPHPGFVIDDMDNPVHCAHGDFASGSGRSK